MHAVIIKKIVTVGMLSLVALCPLQAQTSYAQEMANWYVKRTAALKAPDGWLNLAGLLWLQEGKNSFGSGKGNQLVFPANSLPPMAGYLERRGNTVTLVATHTKGITVDGQSVKTARVFDTGQFKVPTMAFKQWRWTLIKRDDKIGIRLRNLNSPLVKQFKGIPYYPIDSSWRIKATLIADEQPTTIAITNVLGQTNQLESAGKLVFTIGQQSYSLVALTEGNELFVIFADATNDVATYGLGRFLYAAKPEADGTVTLDFNKAFNPPCAFTRYATCPLPPQQNRLPIAITAGEKRYGNH